MDVSAKRFGTLNRALPVPQPEAKGVLGAEEDIGDIEAVEAKEPPMAQVNKPYIQPPQGSFGVSVPNIRHKASLYDMQ